jgi:phage replication-related protein YjqB (UPF0714/DUF867 family)
MLTFWRGYEEQIMVDKYKNFTELSKNEIEGKDYKICMPEGGKHSDIAIIAPHGGGIEAYTSELCREIANGEFLSYQFEGNNKNGNWQLHITSTNFDEPKCLKLLERAKFVVAIHGMKDPDSEDAHVWVGGMDDELAKAIIESLNAFEGDIAKHKTCGKFTGRSKDNICNRGFNKKGVQLEISKKVRDHLRDNEALQQRFCVAIRDAIIQHANKIIRAQ